MSPHTIRRMTAMLALLASLAATAGAAAAGVDNAAGGIDTGSAVATVVRMVLSLGAVLALVAALAWLAQRLRQGTRARGGLIEIVGGLSLGTREKVVLLRVGNEQVLVGMSPAGMRALHVIRDAPGAAPFSSLMDERP
jgi:flagellar protein FliO/FliZ